MKPAAEKRRGIRRVLKLACISAAVILAQPPAPGEMEIVAPDVSMLEFADSQSQVQARLLSDTGAIAWGEKFNVGVLLQIRPEWHVYWKDPGSTGVATDVNFTVPDGFEVDPILWPVPRKFTQPGDIVGYGYAEKVMLTTRITPPPELPAGQKITIGAEVSWLACRDKCIPGRADLQLALPIAKKPRPDNKQLFARWTGRLPKPHQQAKEVNEVSVTGPQFEEDKNADNFEIIIKWRKKPKEVEFFPAAGDALLVNDISIQTQQKTTVITAALKLLNAKKSPASMEAVVAYAGLQEHPEGIEIRIPITSRKEIKK